MSTSPENPYKPPVSSLGKDARRVARGCAVFVGLILTCIAALVAFVSSCWVVSTHDPFHDPGRGPAREYVSISLAGVLAGAVAAGLILYLGGWLSFPARRRSADPTPPEQHP